MKRIIRNMTLMLPVAAIVAIAGCKEQSTAESEVVPEPDKLDNTVWTSYHANGVDIIGFADGKCANRFYDAITGDEETERNSYRLVDNYIEITQPDSVTYRLYYEITAGGSALSVYKSLDDLNNNKPNVVFKKL